MKTQSLFLYLILFITPIISMAQTEAPTNPVLVKVNGVAITQNEVKHFITKQGKEVPLQVAIQEMINVELLSQAAKNEDVMKDQSLLLEIKRTTSALIASNYLQKHLRSIEISEEDLKTRYNLDYKTDSQSKEYNANHILVKTETEAVDIIKKLDDNAEFAELAKTLSIGPSGKNGGSLGWFKKTDMVAPFSQATMELEAGKHSEKPVQTQFGWHVILLNEMRTPEPPAFETVRKQLSTAIAADSISSKIKSLHDSANIELNPEK